MRVLVKKPGQEPEIMELGSLVDINKIVGNLDENGNGLREPSSDIRMTIGPKIDEYCKADALINFDMEPNIWNHNNMGVLHGTVIFTGIDVDDHFNPCSLTDDQIAFCLDYINRQSI